MGPCLAVPLDLHLMSLHRYCGDFQVSADRTHRLRTTAVLLGLVIRIQLYVYTHFLCTLGLFLDFLQFARRGENRSRVIETFDCQSLPVPPRTGELPYLNTALCFSNL